MRRAVTLGVLAAGAAIAAAAPAQAAPTIYFVQGSYAEPAYTTATVFQSFESAPANTAYTAGTNEAVSGTVNVMSGTVPGLSVDPTPSGVGGNNYLDIVNGSYSYAFTTPVQFFSFILGSLDTYNSLKLTFSDNTSQIFTGAQIVGQPVVFNSTGNSGTAGRVAFDVGGGAGITSATFSSTQAAFEIDALASAVPEPATWGLMILGVGMAGAQMRGRRRSKLAVA